MFLFGGPNIRKMAEEQDVDGLAEALHSGSPQVRLEAGEALARLNDERGFSYLLEAVKDATDPLIQAATAEILAGLGDPRAIPALRQAGLHARGETAGVIEEALLSLGEAPVKHQEIEPDPSVLETMVTPVAGAGMAMLGDFTEPGHPAAMEAGQIEVRPAETHLRIAIDLREAELQERGLVEARVAAWLRPDWAEAWYMRGVMLEDLEREREALIAYQAAVDLDPNHAGAREARDELQESVGSPAGQPYDLGLLGKGEFTGSDWRDRRDTLASLQPGSEAPDELVVAMLDDDEREVRHAAIEAIGRLNIHSAAPALLAQQESSWLLRFAIIDALSSLGAVDELVARLRGEMDQMVPRNPVLSSSRDPLAELEYDQLFEIGLLALDRTGDVPKLLEQVEGFAWEEVEEAEAAEILGEGEAPDEFLEEAEDTEILEEGEALDEDLEEEEEADEDLLSYVDETGLIIAQALERLATRRMAELSPDLVQRLSLIPDLTLLDPTNEEAGPVVVHDLSALRAAAGQALANP